MSEKYVNERLSQEDCNLAKEMCKKSRPMMDVPTSQVFPYITVLCCCCYRSQKKEIKKSKNIDQLANKMLKNV